MGTARALLFAAALAGSLGELTHGLCFMAEPSRRHACCETGGERMGSSCCHAHPAESLVAAPAPASGLTAVAHAAGPVSPSPASALAPVSAEPQRDHPPPPSVLRI